MEADGDTEDCSLLRTSYNMKRKIKMTKIRTAAARRLKHHLSAGKQQGSGMYSLVGRKFLLSSPSGISV